MKTIGLIGGMSWESTVTYYKVINETVKEQLGGLHSAKCILYSVDFQEIETCQARGEWEKSGEILTEAAKALERAGAELLLICTNTMHKVAPQVSEGVKVPLLHIAQATAEQLHLSHITRVGLLGTKYTMEQDFYKEVLRQQGIEVLTPGEKDRELVNDVIYKELCLGIISPQSRKEYVRIIQQLSRQGAQGVILGCTEIGLLVSEKDISVPLFDTTLIHGRQAALAALEE